MRRLRRHRHGSPWSTNASHGFDETVDFDDIAVRGLEASSRRPRSSTESRVAFLRADARRGRHGPQPWHQRTRAERGQHGLADRGGRIEVLVDDREGQGRSGAGDDRRQQHGHTAGFPARQRRALGTQIVNSLVQDLRGAIRWEGCQPHGTRCASSCLRPLEPGELGLSRRGGRQALRRECAALVLGQTTPERPESWPFSSAPTSDRCRPPHTDGRPPWPLRSARSRDLFPVGKNSSGSSSGHAARSYSP